MFRCDVCDSIAPPHTAPERVVVETRRVHYPHRAKVHWHPPKHGEKGKFVDDPGGTGVETVRELQVCADCAARLRAANKTDPP